MFMLGLVLLQEIATAVTTIMVSSAGTTTIRLRLQPDLELALHFKETTVKFPS